MSNNQSAPEHLTDLFNPYPPSSYYAPPPPPVVDTATHPGQYRDCTLDFAPPVPPKDQATSSASTNIRSIIASWRARAGSPSQRVIGSTGTGKGGESPKLFGRDRGWPNLSLRRKNRYEGREQDRPTGLSEGAGTGGEISEHADQSTALPEGHVEPFLTGMPTSPMDRPDPTRRTPSNRSVRSVGSYFSAGRSEPLRLTGEVCRVRACVCD